MKAKSPKAKKDNTRVERMRVWRAKVRVWLGRHGYRSVEGLMGALLRGDVVLVTKAKAKR